MRIDHVPIKGALLGVWQTAFRRVLDFKEISRPLVHVLPERTYEVKNIKFVVKVNRGGTRAPDYVEHERKSMCNLLLRFWTEDQGQDIAEYAVMLAVILVLVVGTIRLVGSNANNAFSSVASSLQ